ncbi:MAG: ATP-binding protein [Planctomycetes bacterium]|nr:ATP-binding protein [Planctomycetota bacterium]
MFSRTLESAAHEAAAMFPVVTVTGPRQSGKTTFCKSVFPKKPYVSLEDHTIRDEAVRDPNGFLRQFKNGAILDEIQNAPQITSDLQVLVDDHKKNGEWILTGSQNLIVTAATSQSLAGRTAMLTLLPLSFEEMTGGKKPPRDLYETLFRGSYPAVLDRKLDPETWYMNYVSTYLDRDVRQIINIGNQIAFKTFTGLCAGRTSQLFNASSLASDCGVSYHTIQSWLSALEASYLVFRLPPYSSNVNKRLTKSPKLHFFDTGLICHLLRINDPEQLRRHPLRGPIFETWVASEIHKYIEHRGRRPHCFFYREHAGRELDLLIDTGASVAAVEVKSGETATADSFHSLHAFAQLHAKDALARGPLDSLLIYGGDQEQSMGGARVLPWFLIDKYKWLQR